MLANDSVEKEKYCRIYWSFTDEAACHETQRPKLANLGQFYQSLDDPLMAARTWYSIETKTYSISILIYIVPIIVLNSTLKNRLKATGKTLILVDCRMLVEPCKIYQAPKLCSQQFSYRFASSHVACLMFACLIA